MLVACRLAGLSTLEENYDAIVATLGSVGCEAKRSDQGFIWLRRRALDRLDTLRQPDEGYSDIIIGLAGPVSVKTVYGCMRSNTRRASVNAFSHSARLPPSSAATARSIA